MIAYIVFKIASIIVPLMPVRFGYWLAGTIGEMAYYVLSRQRNGVKGNLRRVLGPQVSDAQLAKVARQAFQAASKNYYDLFRIPKLSLSELEGTVKVEGWEHLYSALDAGRGALLFSAHLGNLELVGQIIMARNMSAVIPVEHVKPERLFKLVTGARTSRGLRMIPIDGGALKAIYKALRTNEIVGMGADRDIQGTGLEMEFFGERTKMPDAPAVLGLRTGTKVLPVCSTRQPDNSFRVVILPAIDLHTTGEIHKDVRVNTERIVRIMEDAIRANPGQWVVFEPVWPDRTVKRERRGDKEVVATAGQS